MQSWRQAADALAFDLEQIFSYRLRAVVAYGPHIDGNGHAPLTCLALVDSLGLADLEACARLVPRWERKNVATPLILPADEFRRSLDAFPLEYGDILRSHVHVYGRDPFEGVAIAEEDLRRACETQVKSHLIHLREGFIEAGDAPGAIADLVRTSAPGFAALLRHVAWLRGVHATNAIDAAVQGGRAASLPDRLVADLVSLAHDTSATAAGDPARLFPEYLSAVEQLARVVDTWRA
jgi:hypothetical protein